MTAITVFLTFLLLIVVLAAGAWAGYLVQGRMVFLEAEYHRIRLASVEESQLFEKKIENLGARLETVERRALDSSQGHSHSINYTQRSQMLRMLRRGDPPEQVASTLRVPLGQIRLLMKLPGVVAVRQKGQASGP